MRMSVAIRPKLCGLGPDRVRPNTTWRRRLAHQEWLQAISKLQLRFIHVVCPTPQPEVRTGGGATFSERHDMVKLEKAGFAASTLLADKRARSAVAAPYLA